MAHGTKKSISRNIFLIVLLVTVAIVDVHSSFIKTCGISGDSCTGSIGYMGCCPAHACAADGSACELSLCSVRGGTCDGIVGCCDSGDSCDNGICTPPCKPLGQSCSIGSDCCTAGQFSGRKNDCIGNQCKSCLTLDQNFNEYCGSDSDCCGNLECGGAIAGRCNNPKTCSAIKESCMFSPDSCCAGLVCSYQDNGSGGFWKYCNYP